MKTYKELTAEFDRRLHYLQAVKLSSNLSSRSRIFMDEDKIFLGNTSSKSLGFYTSTEAARISQVPQWTLNSWRRNGIIIPSMRWIDEFNMDHMGHTFENIVFMRLVRILREKGISLYHSVDAVKKVRDRFGPPSKGWIQARIFVENKDVFVYSNKDKWETTVATRERQRVAEFIFGKEFALLKERADALLIPSQFMKDVEIDLAVHNGLPLVLETTILTRTVHSLRQQGYEYADIQGMYPFIPSQRIVGAEEYETFLDKALAKQNLN